MSAAFAQDEVAEELPARRPLDQNWRKLLNYGLLLALVLIFVALTNMPVNLNRRLLIEPIFSMGYLSLLWLPAIFGFLICRESVLAGMPSHAKGSRDVACRLARRLDRGRRSQHPHFPSGQFQPPRSIGQLESSVA